MSGIGSTSNPILGLKDDVHNGHDQERPIATWLAGIHPACIGSQVSYLRSTRVCPIRRGFDGESSPDTVEDYRTSIELFTAHLEYGRRRMTRAFIHSFRPGMCVIPWEGGVSLASNGLCIGIRNGIPSGISKSVWNDLDIRRIFVLSSTARDEGKGKSKRRPVIPAGLVPLSVHGWMDDTGHNTGEKNGTAQQSPPIRRGSLSPNDDRHKGDEGWVIFITSPMIRRLYHHHQCDGD